MKQLYQWPDINILNESAWKEHKWPLLESLTDEDLENFDIAYPNRNADFNLFMNEKKVAPSIS